ncbi:hypothetical protein WDV93_18755 [Pantoea ananatis]
MESEGRRESLQELLARIKFALRPFICAIVSAGSVANDRRQRAWLCGLRKAVVR